MSTDVAAWLSADASVPIPLHTQQGEHQPSSASKTVTLNSAKKQPKTNEALQFLDPHLLATSPLEAGVGLTSKGCADVPNPAGRQLKTCFIYHLGTSLEGSFGNCSLLFKYYLNNIQLLFAAHTNRFCIGTQRISYHVSTDFLRQCKQGV